ncbi:MAG: serine hydrolase [Bacteroidota bacterium]
MKIILHLAILIMTINTVKAQPFNPQLSVMLQDTLDACVAGITNVKGMSAGVYVPGQGIWQGTSGVSYSGCPVSEDMKFGIASNTKLFVATAMLILAEDNLLSMDDSLQRWLPVYPNIDPHITIRQLLNHTSGISEPLSVSPWMDTIMNNPTRVFTPDEVLGWVGAPLFMPGTGWGYSNINYILAGMVAESATGIHISQIIRDSIMTPLNLYNTFYDVEEPEIDTVAHRWYNNVDYSDTSRVGLNTAGGCAGALFSSSADMVNWYNALMNGQILDSASFAELTDFIAGPASYTYGLGLENQSFFGHTTWGHGGSTWGYKSRMVYDPCMGITVCGLANSFPAGMDGITLLLFRVLVNHLPGCGVTITGPSGVCRGDSLVTYTVSEITNATSYHWSLPEGVTGTSITNIITVSFGPSAVSGDIVVKGVNIYGEGAAATGTVTVNPMPEPPVVTQNNNDLVSNAPAGNQWYDAYGLISGAVNQVYTPVANGDYYTIVTLTGCSSEPSNMVNFNLTGLSRMEDALPVVAYPNPFNEALIIEPGGCGEKTSIEMINSSGQVVYKGLLTGRVLVPTADLRSGVYHINAVSGRSFKVIKIIKE